MNDTESNFRVQLALLLVRKLLERNNGIIDVVVRNSSDPSKATEYYKRNIALLRKSNTRIYPKVCEKRLRSKPYIVLYTFFLFFFDGEI